MQNSNVLEADKLGTDELQKDLLTIDPWHQGVAQIIIPSLIVKVLVIQELRIQPLFVTLELFRDGFTVDLNSEKLLAEHFFAEWLILGLFRNVNEKDCAILWYKICHQINVIGCQERYL